MRPGQTLAERLGYSYGIAQVLLNRGHVARVSGDLAGAQSTWEEGLNVSRSNAYQALEFYYLLLLGLVALEQGDRARAGALGSESLALAKQIGHVRRRASSLQVLGLVAAGHGDHAAGRSLLEESLALHREHADRDGLEGSLQALAFLSIDQGDAPTASRLFAESLTLAREGGDRWEIARSLDGLAGVAIKTRPDRAVRLAGAASALREVLGVLPQPEDRERLDRWLDAAQRRLGPEAYTAAWTAGLGMPLDHAVDLALTQEDDPDQALQAGDLVAKDLFSPLSAREWEVARLVAHGYTNRQIAEQLVIAPRTADTHVGNILSKLNLHSSAELAAWAVTHGLSAGRSD